MSFTLRKPELGKAVTMSRLMVSRSLSAVFFCRITAARGTMVVLLLAFALPAASAELVPPVALVVVDRLAAPEGKSLPEVRWLLQVPGEPAVDEQAVTALNRKSYLRCRTLLPGDCRPQVEKSYRTPAGANSSSGARRLSIRRASFTRTRGSLGSRWSISWNWATENRPRQPRT